MKLIVAVDKNWAIGLRNKLLVSIPNDMKFFREVTTGHVVVMGRKTMESFPGGMPLKKRTNIVLTKNSSFKAGDAIVVTDKEELLKEIEKYDTDEVYVIGGESIYRMLLPYCDTAYITKINYEYEADTYIPNLDEDDEWELIEESEEETCFDLEYKFTTYRRKQGK
ncbi:MAG: dihydrofolate reductase [Eubacterium sp.]|nr:dihydrofolate reductase [Eubacterium sp.]